MLRLRTLSLLLIPILIFIIGLRLMLPTIVLNYVNAVLNRLPDYRGHVSDVQLALIRGAYVIKDLKLEKRSGKVYQPFVAIPSADLSIQWNAIFHGKVVGEMELERPTVNLVNSSNSSETQLQTKGDWQGIVRDLFPLKFNRVGIHHGIITYRHAGTQDETSVELADIEGSVENLTNRPVSNQALPAPLRLTGTLQKYAPVKINGKIDPISDDENFDLDLTIDTLPLPKLNNLLKQSIHVDAQGGTFQMYAEVACKKGEYHGYLKPILHDVKIFSISKDAPNPFALVWEGLVGFVTEIFTNQRHDQFAAKIPFEGKIDDPSVDIFGALMTIARNAFIKALSAKVDNSISFDNEKAKEKKDTPEIREGYPQ